jgi:hypothetical protein
LGFDRRVMFRLVRGRIVLCVAVFLVVGCSRPGQSNLKRDFTQALFFEKDPVRAAPMMCNPSDARLAMLGLNSLFGADFKASKLRGATRITGAGQTTSVAIEIRRRGNRLLVASEGYLATIINEGRRLESIREYRERANGGTPSTVLSPFATSDGECVGVR